MPVRSVKNGERIGFTTGRTSASYSSTTAYSSLSRKAPICTISRSWPGADQSCSMAPVQVVNSRSKMTKVGKTLLSLWHEGGYGKRSTHQPP